MKYNIEKPKSTLLVKLIGIPNVCKPTFFQLRTEDVPDFLQIAEQNKIPLLFLRNLASGLESPSVKSTLLRYEKEYKRTMDLMGFVASTLEPVNANYTLFKTLKPFPYVPSDVDVLLLSDNDLKKVVRALMSEGCIVLDGDAYGVTMFSPIHKMNIDLTTQIAVSGLVYVNKELLIDHVCELDVHGTIVRTLSSPADLLVVTAHSIFKEQMFTLSDYYAFVTLAQYWEETSKLAEKLHLKHALNTLLNMTRSVTLDAFGPLNPLTKEFNALGITYAISASENNIELPKKYDVSTIVVEFLKKLMTDSVTLSSLSSAARSFYNPSFYRKLLQHATREKY